MAAKTKSLAKSARNKSWLATAARLLWWLVFAIFVIVFVRELSAMVADPAAAFQLLTAPDSATEARGVEALGWSQGLYVFVYLLPEVLAAIGFLTVGVLIGVRPTNDWFSWFTSLWMIVFGIASSSVFIVGAQTEGLQTLLFYISVLFSYMGILIFLLTFPDGKFAPNWTRYFAILWAVFILSTVVVPWFDWDSSLSAVAIVPLLVVVLYSAIYRYRKVFTVAQREQTKWLIAAVAANIVLILISGYFREQATAASGTAASASFLLLSNAADYFANILLVAAVGISILRYRLWDIDVVVNRALIYGPLSVILAAIFAVSVALINQTTRQLLGAEATVTATAISALVVATVFQPIRLRIETWINKRLYPDNANLARELVEISDPRFALSAPALTKQVAERISRVLGSDEGAVYLTDGKGFKLAAKAGKAKAEPKFGLDAKARAELSAGKITSDGPGHLLVPLYVPRLRNKELVGALALGLRKNGRGYSSDDKAALVELGGHVGTALYAAQLRSRRR
jgi:hypothetical protein